MSGEEKWDRSNPFAWAQARVEPDAGMRKVGHGTMTIFQSFVGAGFTEGQALALTQTWLAEAIRSGQS